MFPGSELIDSESILTWNYAEPDEVRLFQRQIDTLKRDKYELRTKLEGKDAIIFQQMETIDKLKNEFREVCRVVSLKGWI